MNILKSDWFSYDKFAHAWLHTIIVRRCRTWGVPPQYAFAYSVIFGVGYEYLWDNFLYHIIVPKLAEWIEWIDYDPNNKYCLKDIVWNTIGGIVGLIL